MKLRNIILTLLLVVGVSFMCACSSSKNVEGSLEEIMDKIYADVSDDEKPMFLENHDVKDNVEYYIGTSNVSFKEGLASESGTGSIAYSVVLLRLNDGVNVEDAKKEIKEKIDPRKWICVGIEREDVVVINNGNLILTIIMDNEDALIRDKMIKSFNNL